MSELFPRRQIVGFIFSIVLTLIALMVYFLQLSFTQGITVLIVTALAQALLQLVYFMHAGETEDRWIIYGKILFMVVMALITVFGTLLIFLWDM